MSNFAVRSLPLNSAQFIIYMFVCLIFSDLYSPEYIVLKPGHTIRRHITGIVWQHDVISHLVTDDWKHGVWCRSEYSANGGTVYRGVSCCTVRVNKPTSQVVRFVCCYNILGSTSLPVSCYTIPNTDPV